ncbi:MAG: carbon storage regulator [Pirellulales bacterium]
MLVLSRKSGESVQLGGAAGEIVIKVIDLGGGRVRLGIEAPQSVTIVRSELGPRPPATREGCAIAQVA